MVVFDNRTIFVSSFIPYAERKIKYFVIFIKVNFVVILRRHSSHPQITPSQLPAPYVSHSCGMMQASLIFSNIFLRSHQFFFSD